MAEVTSSSLVGSTLFFSILQQTIALTLHGGGRRFESHRLHSENLLNQRVSSFSAPNQIVNVVSLILLFWFCVGVMWGSSSLLLLALVVWSTSPLASVYLSAATPVFVY
jgi:hypothetical protein